MPFGKGMLEKNLIPLEEEPQNIYSARTILQGSVLTHFGFAGCFYEEAHPELSQLREYQLQGPFSWQGNQTFWVYAAVLPKTSFCLELADFGGTPGCLFQAPLTWGILYCLPSLLHLSCGMLIAAGS